jgi:hypothetical protein
MPLAIGCRDPLLVRFIIPDLCNVMIVCVMF